MSQVCEKCGKIPSVGHNVSHSNRKTKRRFNPNLQRKAIFDFASKKMITKRLCTRCIKTYSKELANF